MDDIIFFYHERVESFVNLNKIMHIFEVIFSYRIDKDIKEKCFVVGVNFDPSKLVRFR